MALKAPKRLYQEIWNNGQSDPGYEFQRPCAERYGPIHDLAKKFNRPFSVLDIGANYAYFSVRLMQDFNCCSVMVDNKLIFPILNANNVLDRSVVIHGHLSAATLEALSRSEHFDIVLGLAVLHHFDDPVRAYHAMRNLGWWSVFEIPGKDDLGAANPHKHQAIRDLFDGIPQNGDFPSHVSDTRRPYYILENQPSIFEQSMDAADRDAPVYCSYRVECDFDRSVFIKDEAEPRPFVPGMNLWNFRRLNGVYPTDDMLKVEMRKYLDHPDFQWWNFVVGFGLTPIDLEAKFV